VNDLGKRAIKILRTLVERGWIEKLWIYGALGPRDRMLGRQKRNTSALGCAGEDGPMKDLLLRFLPDCTPKQAESMIAVACAALVLGLLII
jgi:hypothetical protein